MKVEPREPAKSFIVYCESCTAYYKTNHLELSCYKCDSKKIKLTPYVADLFHCDDCWQWYLVSEGHEC